MRRGRGGNVYECHCGPARVPRQPRCSAWTNGCFQAGTLLDHLVKTNLEDAVWAWRGTEFVGEKRANALHGIDLDAFTLPRPRCLFVCGVFVAHYKDKINKVMWAFAGDALTDAYLEQAALVVDYRQGVGIGEAYGDQSMPVNPGDSLYTVLFSTLMPHLFASRSGRLQANHRSRCAKLRGCEIPLCIPLTFRRRHDKLLASSFDDERF